MKQETSAEHQAAEQSNCCGHCYSQDAGTVFKPLDTRLLEPQSVYAHGMNVAVHARPMPMQHTGTLYHTNLHKQLRDVHMRGVSTTPPACRDERRGIAPTGQRPSSAHPQHIVHSSSFGRCVRNWRPTLSVAASRLGRTYQA